MVTIAEAFESYLRDLAVGQSAQTVETYSQGLARLREFLALNQCPPSQPVSILKVTHALGCAQWLSDKRETRSGKLAKATLRTYLATLSRFYSYLLREELVSLSAADLQRMREAFRNYRRGYERPLPKLPTDDAVRDLLTAARNVRSDPKSPRLGLARMRNIAMLEALRSGGMRVGELVGLKRDDVDYRQHSARVTGKGNKQRIIYFDDKAWNAIQSYIKSRGDGAKGRALYQLPLFARHDRRAGNRVLPLTTDGVRLVFNEIARAAGIEIAMTPHSLRHAFATRVLEATGDLAVVQDMLGHSSPATTRIYAKVSSRRMREAHRAAFDYEGNKEEEE